MAVEYTVDSTKNMIQIPTTGIEAVLSEEIPKTTVFTRDEWGSREDVLLSHAHAIAEC